MSDIESLLAESFRRGFAQVSQRPGRDLATLARQAGLPPDLVAKALADKADLDLDQQAALARAAGYHYEDLLGLGRALIEGRATAQPLEPSRAVALYLEQLLKVVGSFRLAEGEEELCQRVVRLLVQIFGFSRVILFLLHDRRLEPTALYWPGGRGDVLLKCLTKETPAWGPDLAEYETLALGRCLPVSVGQTDLFGPASSGLLGQDCEIALAPLFTERQFVGLLSADFGPRARALNDADLALVETYAALAGTLLNNQRLYAELQRKHHELDLRLRELMVVGEMTRVLNQALGPEQVAQDLLALLVDSLGAHSGFLFLHDEDARQLRLLGSHGLEPELAQDWATLPCQDLEQLLVALEGPEAQRQQSPELSRLLPGLTPPALIRGLRTRGKLMGLWGLGRRPGSPPFPGGQERVLATADEQMGVVLNSWRLRLLATTDFLTGLSTRARFVETLEKELRVAGYLGHPLSLIFLDADHFKRINDRHGHPAGDAVLAGLADCLRQTTRSSDTLARVGGEEFAVILPRCDQERGKELAERIRERVAAMRVEHRQHALRITVSLGLATWNPGDAASPDELVERADQALYRAKHAGRNRVAIYHPSQDTRTWGSLD